MNDADANALFTATDFTRRKLRREKLASTIFGTMAVLILIPLVLIIIHMVVKAWPVLSWGLIADMPKDGMRAGGLRPVIIGTLYLVVVSRLISTPIGVLAGIYLNEFARDNWFTRIVNLAVVNLAGVPSIVHALFGVGAFVLFAGIGKSILAASLTLAIMTMPVLIASTKEALASVPMAFREACWNVGASKWQTIRTIVLPNSVSGILTGVILEVCRAAGETAPIMYTGAIYWRSIPKDTLFPYGPFDQCMALSYHVYTIATQVPHMPASMMYGTAVVLVGFVLVFNSFAIALRSYMRSRKKW
ncbi:MAG: phosphate ABC transporter permease PstA [Planctomycetes bacterium]|nr:phosphate ABC transporter permease PstA [Planctomycetota bacterium]